MSPSQKSLYWRKWSRVRKALVELGDYSAAEADQHRHEIHTEALGRDKSSKELNNRDLDRIFDHFDSILVLLDGPKTIDRTTAEPGRRLVYSIQQLGLPEPYIQSISRAQFQSGDWQNLSESQLTRLRYTLTARSRALQKKAAAASPEGDDPF